MEKKVLAKKGNFTPFPFGLNLVPSTKQITDSVEE